MLGANEEMAQRTTIKQKVEKDIKRKDFDNRDLQRTQL